MPSIFSMNLKFSKGFPPRKRDFNNTVKATLHRVGEEWHSEMMPRHFTAEGGRYYGYRMRDGQSWSDKTGSWFRTYSGKKFRKFGHEKPLVFSGQGQVLAALKNIRSTQHKATVVLPSKFNFRGKGSNINMREELTRIMPREANDLRKLAAKDHAERIAKL